MILRPAICSSSLLLVGALLFGGLVMLDTVTSPQGEYLAVAADSASWPVPTTLTANGASAKAFVTRFVLDAFPPNHGCLSVDEYRVNAFTALSPFMREGFASAFWTKPACGHQVEFQLQNVEQIDVGPTNGAWFEVHGQFTHGKLQPIPVTMAILVGGTPEGGMQIEGYSELTDPLEKLMVASCNDHDDCDKDCDHDHQHGHK